ncbi:MAG: metallophosphoesterase [Victivallales bacterium]|nr:metallophosphoesterase [Victivallales bacterium]
MKYLLAILMISAALLHAAAISGVNVEYSANPTRLTASVPFVQADFVFGTGMTAEVWQALPWVEESSPFPAGKPLLPMKFKVFRTADSLYVGFLMLGKPQERCYPAEPRDGQAVWEADMAELHFGGLEPAPWHWQSAVGIRGNRYDSEGKYACWDAKVFECEEGWGAEVRYDLTQIHCADGGFRFNLCRMDTRQGASPAWATWSPVATGFHCIEDYGELLLLSYEDALSLRFGVSVPGATRQEYQRRADALRVPSTAVTHGPWLTNPAPGQMTVNWTTAGRARGGVEWRPKDSDETPSRKFSGSRDGIAAAELFHSVDLTGLEPGIPYEFRLVSLTPQERLEYSEWHSFRSVPESGQGKLFHFFAVTDIHSDVVHLAKALATPEAKRADLLLNLGDHVSRALGQEALFTAVVDPVANALRGDFAKPVVYLRGNHEQLGTYAGDYSRLMRFPNGKTWRAFTYGETFFLVLDSGAERYDSPDKPWLDNSGMLAEECDFIRAAVASPAYREARWRIVLVHIPPYLLQSQEKHPFGRLEELLVTADAQPDILLAGHIHEYGHLPAGATAFTETSTPWHRRFNGKIHPVPFPEIVIANQGALAAEVTHDQIVFTCLDLSGDAPQVIETVTISPRTMK